MALLPKRKGAIFYDVHGSGPDLVMLRGLGRSIRHWMGYEKDMARHFRVITVELRGIGNSTAPLAPTDTLFDLADDICEVLDVLNIESAHILGVSLGGMLALALGLKHPGRCKSIITINTSIGGQRTLRMSLPGIWTIVSGLVGDKLKIHSQLVDILTSPTFPKDKRPAVAAKLVEIAESDGLFVPTVVKQLVMAMRFQVRERLKDMRLPTLLVYGTDDQFVPNINTRKLSAVLPNSRLVAIKDAGHEMMIDQPDALREAVTAWVSEHEGGDAGQKQQRH